MDASIKWEFMNQINQFSSVGKLCPSLCNPMHCSTSAYNAGDLGLIPGLGRSSGEGNDNPVQYSCLENPMDRGAWWAAVHGCKESGTTE